jgi:DNA-binding IclR family transcriptional regulator
MTYDLRRLRLHGLIERLPRTHRYQLTPAGLRTALFFTRTYARLFRTGLAQILPASPSPTSKLRAAFDRLDQAIDHWCLANKLVA